MKKDTRKTDFFDDRDDSFAETTRQGEPIPKCIATRVTEIFYFDNDHMIKKYSNDDILYVLKLYIELTEIINMKKKIENILDIGSPKHLTTLMMTESAIYGVMLLKQYESENIIQEGCQPSDVEMGSAPAN